MELQMWITIFALTFATAIIFSVAAVSEAAFYRLKRAKYLVCNIYCCHAEDKIAVAKVKANS